MHKFNSLKVKLPDHLMKCLLNEKYHPNRNVHKQEKDFELLTEGKTLIKNIDNGTAILQYYYIGISKKTDVHNS